MSKEIPYGGSREHRRGAEADLQEADARADTLLQVSQAPPDTAKHDAALYVSQHAQAQRGLVTDGLLPATLEQQRQLAAHRCLRRLRRHGALCRDSVGRRHRRLCSKPSRVDTQLEHEHNRGSILLDATR